MGLIKDIDSLMGQKQSALDRWKASTGDNLSVNSPQSQAVLNEAKETLAEQNKQALATAAVMGTSPTALAAQKQANAQAYGQTLRQLTGSLAQQRVAADQQFLASQQQLLSERIARKQQTVDNIAKAAGGLVQGVLGAMAPGMGAAGKVVSTVAQAAEGTANAVQGNDYYDSSRLIKA